MHITDLLSPDSIRLNAAPADKQEAIDQLVALQVKGGQITEAKAYKKGILDREAMSSTAVGNGVAIPHAKSAAVKAPSLAAMTVPGGVDYQAMDGKPSQLLFMIAAPEDGDVHLEVLSRLMTMLMGETFRQNLLAARDKEEFLQVIRRMEEEKAAAPKAQSGQRLQVLAVTACPTGIAHTYMAAETLEQAARKLGMTLKVETNGSAGVKNRLTGEEIAQCDGVIVAADKSVEMSRFDGKRVLSVPVSEAIKKPEKLLRRVQRGDAPEYRHTGARTAPADSGGDGLGRSFYKHLMNGVSNMLPFTVSGGIFIALAFLIDAAAGMPQDAGFGAHTPLAAFLKTIGGFAFNFMVPVLAGYIGQSIADRPGFLVGLVGGYLAATGSTFSNPAGDIPSGFLGALLAGFAGGFVMLGVERLCERMPHALNGIKPVLIYPLAGLGLIAVILCAVNPFMGMLNTGLSDLLGRMGGSSKILLGCVLGGMMSIDMGGPFNKAAYVFGVASIASGDYDVMAAVMVGGMVPPIAIALSTTFFRSRWTEEERKNGVVNYIMGLSFITEGAIPYAASDPLRVLPACIVGSAVAGGLSMAFRCTLMAPHGGIFVFAVVGSWPMYLLALAAGSAVGMLLLAILKKPVDP